MNKVNDDMLAKFKGIVGDKKLTRTDFMKAFFGVLLGDVPAIPEARLDKYLKWCIDNTSLCVPEIMFMNAMVEAPYSISGYIKLFNDTKDLYDCQLGSLMLRMLESVVAREMTPV